MKNKNINIRCTQEQMAEIKRNAQLYNLTTSEYILRMIAEDTARMNKYGIIKGDEKNDW